MWVKTSGQKLVINIDAAFKYTISEETAAVLAMRAKVAVCMLENDEESCLRALFDHSYFWNK